MDQLKRLYENLTLRQKLSLLGAALAVIGGLALFSNWNRERDFKPLYTNLSSEDASGVVTKLKEANTDYRLTENGSTIKVPAAKVDEMRLSMAAAGLPKTGRLGFELFDKTNFGATEFTEQVNYHRAIEGELERSVMSLNEVEHARIHITFPKQSVFLESREPAKASVVLKLKVGARLSPQNVLAVCHLVASAVEGLLPESVSIVDMNGNLLNRPRKPSDDGVEASDLVIEHKKKLETDMLAKINATLDPLLGSERYKAAVSIDCDLTSGEQSEEVFDPDRSVMVSSQKTEDSTGASTAGGTPGTASNLPRPPQRQGGGGTNTSRKTDNLQFQTSRMVKRTKLPQGAVKQLSVSVLLDHNVRWEGAVGKEKRIVEAPAPEKLKAIREVVAGVVGLNEVRGDRLIVESLLFENTLQWRPAPTQAPQAARPKIKLPWAPAWLAPPLEAFLQDVMESKFVIPAAAAMAMAIFLIPAALFRWLFRRLRKKGSVEMKKEVGEREAAGELAAAEQGAPKVDLAKQLEAKLAEKAAQRAADEVQALAMLKLPDVPTKRGEVLAKHIAEEARRNPEPMAQLIRTWLHEQEQ
jgi:flagellar M-ring protein FliF